MQSIIFKTSLQCGNCVKAVSNVLDGNKSISEWFVDTTSEEKLLTVRGVGIDTNEIINQIQSLGFDIQKLSEL